MRGVGEEGQGVCVCVCVEGKGVSPDSQVTYLNRALPHLVHEGQHLQCEHVLSQVISILGNDLDGRLVDGSGIYITELQP